MRHLEKNISRDSSHSYIVVFLLWTRKEKLLKYSKALASPPQVTFSLSSGLYIQWASCALQRGDWQKGKWGFKSSPCSAHQARKLGQSRERCLCKIHTDGPMCKLWPSPTSMSTNMEVEMKFHSYIGVLRVNAIQ